MRDLTTGPSFVEVGCSNVADPRHAVHCAAADLTLQNACFIIAFIPNRFDIDTIVDAMADRLAGLPVFGCTTAGQITTEGYEADTLMLLAFPRSHFRCASMLVEDLRPLNATSVASRAQRFVEQFQHSAHWNRLAVIFTDGLSKQEDLLVSTLESVLVDLPIFGGSAGDGLRFQQTFVLHEGRAHTNAAVLLLIETDLEFQGLGFDHFLPGGAQLIITEADPDERLVYEINGAPAALEYARLVGCDVNALSPEVFAENPLLLQHNSVHYVRAINNATEGHALCFLAAIDDGLIMTLGQGREILQTLESGLTLQDRLGRSPDFVLGFDCVLRKLEIAQKDLLSDVSEILRRHRVFGFNTYGEQQSGVHMNQTFVGVAFFEPEERSFG